MAAIISPGGQIYDRTTGTWEGSMRTTVGNGLSQDARENLNVKVWRDAEGITGLELLKPNPGGGAGPASGHVNNSAQPGAGGLGPGSAAAVTSGRGSTLAPLTVWWEEVGEGAGVAPGTRVNVGSLPPLQPVMASTNTAIMIGGVPLLPHPGTSDAQAIEDMLGEGDSPLDLAWYVRQAAVVTHLTYNFSNWYRSTPLGPVSEEQKRANSDAIGRFFAPVAQAFGDAMARRSGALPPQEPVDWGR